MTQDLAHPQFVTPLASERLQAVVPGVKTRSASDRDISSPSNSAFVNPLEYQRWNTLVGKFAAATPFHTEQWARVLSESYGYEPCYVVFPPSTADQLNGSPNYAPTAVLSLFDVKSALTGRRGISLPFTDSCAPLLRVGEDSPRRSSAKAGPDEFRAHPPTGASSLLSAAVELGRARNWKYLELRGATACFTDSTIQQSNDSTRVPDFVQHDLDLTIGESSLWQNLDSGCQRAIRKARNAGVTTRRTDFSSPRSTADLREFYRLQCRTRRKHGLPPQPFRFFELVGRHMLESGLGSLYLAERSGQIIAGAIYLHFGKSVIFKYGASDERHLELRANNLIMWNAIADYAQAGAANLNFGRTEAAHSGLRRYKTSFGCRENSLYYHRFDYKMNSLVAQKPTGNAAIGWLFRVMPASVAQICGSLLYRHVA